MTAIDLSEKVRSEIATLILGREFEEV